MNNVSPDTLHAPVLEALNLPWKNVCHLGEKVIAGDQARMVDDKTCLDFFYLAHGRINIMHADEFGRERAIFCLGSGNLFNEAPAVAGFGVPNSPCVCLGECHFYRFSHKILHDPDFISSNPLLIINLMRCLGIKLLILHTSLSNFTGTHAVARVSRFFVALFSRQKELCFDPSMTQDSLAILLGMNRGTLVRALRDLKDCGAIRTFTKHRLEIGDLDMLRRLAEN